MPRGRISAALLAAAIFCPAAAQEPPLRTEYERLTERPKPLPEVPAELRAVVVAVSPARLEVRALSGQVIPVDIEWWEPSEFRLLRRGRFLGMRRSGYEDYGYVLVDRAAAGERAVLDTGHLPRFSADGRFFAAAEVSPAGYSNLEGIAVWEVLEDRTVRRFYTDALPDAWEWRIDSWPRPDCVALSMVPMDWTPPDGEDWDTALPRAPRNRYRLSIGEGVSLEASGEEAPCAGGAADG